MPTARSRNIRITFYTLATVGLILGAYYFIFVKEQTSRLDERNFRILAQVNRNVQLKYQTFEQVVSNAPRTAEALRRRALGRVNARIAARNRELVDDFEAAVLAISGQSYRSLRQVAGDNYQLYLDDWYRTDSTLPPPPVEIPPATLDQIRFTRRGFELVGRAERGESFDALAEDLSEELALDVRLIPPSKDLPPDDPVIFKGEDQQWYFLYDAIRVGDQAGLMYALGLTDFMRPLRRAEVFDQLMVFRLRPGETDAGQPADLIYQTFGTMVRVERLPDTLLRTEGNLGLQFNARRELRLGGEEYVGYFQPLTLEHEEFVVAGLVTRNHFNRGRYRISTLLILALLLLLFILALSLPVLRLYLLSPFERLRSRDAIAVLVSALLGTSAIVLLLFDGYVYTIEENVERKAQLATLSREIESRFFTEITRAYDQLITYDSLALAGKVTERAYTRILARDPATNRYLTDPDLVPRQYPWFNSVFWAGLDDSLFQEITPQTDAAPQVDISGREYLNNLKQERYSLLESRRGSTGSGKFSLQSILARTTGNHLAVVAVPSRRNDASIVMLTTRLYSLYQPVLPEGFGFALINPQGEVLFHSDPSHNLQENFLVESGPRTLESAIFARTQHYAEGFYQGSPYNMLIQPLENLPIFLVVFQNQLLVTNTHEQILSFSFLLMMLSFLLGLIMVLLMWAFTSRRGRLQGSRFVFSWLRPTDAQVSNYHALFFFNLGNLLVLFILTTINRIGLPATVLMFGLAQVYILGLVYVVLRREAVQVNLRSMLSRRVSRFRLASVVLIILINSLAYVVAPGKYIFLVIYQITVLFGASACYQAVHMSKGRTRLEKLLHRYLPQRRAYLVFMMSWLLLLTALPTLTYLSLTYDREYQLALKYNQLNMGRDAQVRRSSVFRQWQNWEGDSLMIRHAMTLGIYTRSYYESLPFSNDAFNAFPPDTVGAVWEVLYPVSVPDKATRNLARYDSLLDRIRPRFNDIVRVTNELRTGIAADSSWFWQRTHGKLLNGKAREALIFRYPGISFNLLSAQPNYQMPVPQKRGLIFWMVLVLGLFTAYFLIDFAIRKLFSARAASLETPSTDILLESLAKPKGREGRGAIKSPQHVYLVIPPRALGTRYRKYLNGIPGISLRDIDTQEEFDQALTSAQKPRRASNEEQAEQFPADAGPAATQIVINHLEDRFEEEEQRRVWLEIVQQAIFEHEQVILVSDMEPAELFMRYNEIIAEAGDTAQQQIMAEEQERWRRVLSRFQVVIYPLNESINFGENEDRSSPRVRLLHEELRHGAFLRRMYSELKALYVSESKITNEEIVLDIEMRAQLYYEVLWDNVLPEEKLLLYDLAEDGLMNDANLRSVRSLLRKGLIINDGGQLKVMNQSFRNYILTRVDPEEALGYEEKGSGVSTWQLVRTPLTIILFTVAAFLFVTQRDLVNSTVAFITGAAALLPAIYRAIEAVTGINLSNMFGRGKK